MRITVIGPGAIGSVFGGRLAAAGHAVTLIARPGLRADMLLRDGLRLTGLGGDVAFPLPVLFDAGDAPPAELVLITVKAYDTVEAIRKHRSAIGPQTMVVSLQNGVGNVEAIVEAVPPAQVLAATTTMGAYIQEDGAVCIAGEGDTAIGEWEGGLSERASRLAGAFAAAGLKAEATDDVRRLLFAKLAVNCAINPLTALVRAPNGVVADRPELAALVRPIVSEVVAVARAEGVTLDEEALAERALAVARATRANRSSMFKDALAGRRTEIDAISGAVAALGLKHGLPTPCNAILAALVASLNS